MTKMTQVDVDAIERQMLEQTNGDVAGVQVAASAKLVNRTHRIVGERAKSMRAQRSRIRSLWVPLAVSATMLATLIFAIWEAFEEIEVSPAGLPEASQTLVLMMWSVPITAMVLAIVWFRRSSMRSDNERAK